MDGIVIEGESYVDEFMIMGEFILVFKKSGEKVIGGMINRNFVFKV